MSFAKRSYKKELMDDLNLASDDLKKNLDELAFINTNLGGYDVLTSAFNKLIKEGKVKERISLADIGSGGGDTLRYLSKWFDKQSISCKGVGLDANEFMLDYSRERSKGFKNISFEKVNVFNLDEAKNIQFDWATLSLFCHHFTDEELIEIFRSVFEKSAKGFVINDLHRHPLAYYSIYFLTRLFGGSYLVQNDAPLSVKRAFKKEEIISLLEKAGIHKYRVSWKWAFRFQVIVEK